MGVILLFDIKSNAQSFYDKGSWKKINEDATSYCKSSTYSIPGHWIIKLKNINLIILKSLRYSKSVVLLWLQILFALYNQGEK